MICTVKEGRYHGLRSCCELLAVMGLVLTQKAKQNSAFQSLGSTGYQPVMDVNYMQRSAGINLSSAGQARRKHRRADPGKTANACAARLRGSIPHRPSQFLLDRRNLLR